jgi:hypothetical protein
MDDSEARRLVKRWLPAAVIADGKLTVDVQDVAMFLQLRDRQLQRLRQIQTDVPPKRSPRRGEGSGSPRRTRAAPPEPQQ